MELANASNGLFVLQDGWMGPQRNADVRDNGASFVADELTVYAYYYLGYINPNDEQATYAMRLSREVLDVTFFAFYARKGEPWKEQFDMIIE